MTRLLIGPVLRYVGETEATIWVETDEPCQVTVLGVSEPTWTVFGHHYALLVIDGLAPGSSTPYSVQLDDETVWPDPRSDRPASRDPHPRARTGRCGWPTAPAATAGVRSPSPTASSTRTRWRPTPAPWPTPTRRSVRTWCSCSGDQVYADEPSEATSGASPSARDRPRAAPDGEVADFEEYTWLYLESWTDPDVRWLMSTIPSTMIFDDHDVRDDWNTSDAWRRDMQATAWWQERIVGGLSSYWVYQHLGNLSPAELAGSELFQAVRGGATDATARLREFAATADREADGGKSVQWSYRRDLGRTRVLMIDSRCGRILAEGRRSMVDENEFAWIDEQLDGDYDHLLVGTSLPWLLARALHDLEAWNESLCAGARGRRWARWSEWLRRAADLEHWAVVPGVVRAAGRDDRRRRRGPAGHRPGHRVRAVRRRAPRLRGRGPLRARRHRPGVPAGLLTAAQLRARAHEAHLPDRVVEDSRPGSCGGCWG